MGNILLVSCLSVNCHISLKIICGNSCYVVLDILVISPEYQRKGVGAMLLREGLKKMDEEGLLTILGASAMGIGLYRKMGFVVEEVLEVDLRPYGMEASRLITMMLRPAMKVAGTA